MLVPNKIIIFFKYGATIKRVALFTFACPLKKNKLSFTVKRGRNEITRRCLHSSVTIPHEVTYRNLDKNRPAASSEAASSFNFCGCGWPQNLLVPKGNTEGFPVQLFVMISNGSLDQVCYFRNIMSYRICLKKKIYLYIIYVKKKTPLLRLYINCKSSTKKTRQRQTA